MLPSSGPYSASYQPYSSTLGSPSAQDRSRAQQGLSSPQAGHIGLVASGNAGGYSSWGGHSGPSPSAGPAGLNEAGRSQYQPGYLLSLSQNQAGQQAAPRFDESLLIPVRAKMNPTFPRNSSPDFGSESMFESSHRHRETMDDGDGPPTSSVVDIVNDVYSDRARPQFFTPKKSGIGLRSGPTATPASPVANQNPTLYVMVYGYPSNRYTSTLTHFQSLAEGGTTEPEPSADVENAFRIGYKQPWEAARAQRRDGEIINGEGGRWIVGVKWTDPLMAEQVLGSGARTFAASTESPFTSPRNTMDITPDVSQVPQRAGEAAPSIGTPIRLAPSALAFKKPSTDSAKKNIGSAVTGTPTSSSGSPSKGMIGQMSELIFGW